MENIKCYNIKKLYVDFNICGSANSLSEKLDNIHKIYSNEEEKKYGILAIYIEKV